MALIVLLQMRSRWVRLQWVARRRQRNNSAQTPVDACREHMEDVIMLSAGMALLHVCQLLFTMSNVQRCTTVT